MGGLVCVCAGLRRGDVDDGARMHSLLSVLLSLTAYFIRWEGGLGGVGWE